MVSATIEKAMEGYTVLQLKAEIRRIKPDIKGMPTLKDDLMQLAYDIGVDHFTKEAKKKSADVQEVKPKASEPKESKPKASKSKESYDLTDVPDKALIDALKKRGYTISLPQ
jgi:hypothetical protein